MLLAHVFGHDGARNDVVFRHPTSIESHEHVEQVLGAVTFCLLAEEPVAFVILIGFDLATLFVASELDARISMPRVFRRVSDAT